MTPRSASTGQPPRNAKRNVVYEYSPSVSRSTSAEPEGDGEDAEGEEIDVDEDDAEGESDYESEGGLGGPSAVPSDAMEVDDEIPMEEDAEGEEEDDDQPLTIPPPSHQQPSMRIKLKIGGANTPPTKSKPRAAAQKSKSKMRKAVDEDEELDELILGDDDSPPGTSAVEEADFESEGDEDNDGDGRAVSPSKLTARQRARGNQDLQETLLALPMDPGNKKLVLTEAEKLQRREETARKRKRQSEQKIQDEMDTTINRLLRAQTSRSRSKLDNPSEPAEDPANPSSRSSPSRRLGTENTILYTSTLKGDSVVLRVAAPKGKEGWIDIGPNGFVDGKVRPSTNERRDKSGPCAVSGCRERRKYRSTKNFEIGGCSLVHLKEVEKSLA